MGRRSWLLCSHIVSLLSYLPVFDEASELKLPHFAHSSFIGDEHLMFYIKSASEYPLNASKNAELIPAQSLPERSPFTRHSPSFPLLLPLATTLPP